jgi:hypothetical protein
LDQPIPLNRSWTVDADMEENELLRHLGINALTAAGFQKCWTLTSKEHLLNRRFKNTFLDALSIPSRNFSKCTFLEDIAAN